MSPESQKYMFIFLGVVVFGLLLGLLVKMMMGCKGAKVDGKCYTIVAQADPAPGLENVNNIKDGKMSTSAKATTIATTITLNVKDATAAAAKKVKGARITAMAAAPVAPAVAADQKITLEGLEFAFKQDGKKYTIGKLFTTEKSITGPMSLVVPSGMTVYEVELI
jgi:hypothetical protein